MNIVYLVFGNQQVLHQQANFSIQALLANGGDFGNIIVITDAPEYYASIVSEQLIIETVSSETIQEWRGVDNYVFRAKIKAIEYIIDKYPKDDLLYLDADTCIVNELKDLQVKISKGYYAMHINEGRIGESKRNTQKGIWKNIKNQTFEGIKIHPNLCMWNAGVIGIPAKENKCYITKVLVVNEAIYQTNIKKKLVEQIAFSILLQQQDKTIECDKEILHYWGNKAPWNAKIADFFMNNHLKSLNFKESVNAIEAFDFQEIPLQVKQSRMAINLKRMIDSFFKTDLI